MSTSRPSVYPPAPGGGLGASASSSASHAQSRAGGAPTAAQRLEAKHAELQGLRVLKDQSARLVKDIEGLGDRVDALVQGGDAFASVMSSWQGVFRAIQISRADMASLAASTASLVGGSAGSVAAGAGAASEHVNVGTLVRIPVDTDSAAAAAAAAGEEGAAQATSAAHAEGKDGE